MPLRLEIRKNLQSRSDRVKSVHVHPTEPWVLTALYSGNVLVWDYQQGSMLKSFEVCTLPVRCAKFIARKQWVVTGSDDMQMRVYNINTMEKLAAWEAHTDYIRFLEVHPTLPYVLSSSDDMTIKLWDWERGWDCFQVFEGHHAHYVMMVKFNPKDSNTFASASLDRTVKVWGLGAPTPHFSLDGHEKGVNCIDYYPGGDKPYLMSGADDQTVKIWDYQTKSCVQTLTGHLGNVSAVLFHPRLPIMVSGSEDGTVRLWHVTTYRAESTLNYGMERCWALDVGTDNNKLAIGYDDGTIVLSLGQDMPVASLDTHTGRVVWGNNSEVQTASLKGVAGEAGGVEDGERLSLAPKDLGSTELFPQKLKHNCNGRFLVVCGDGEWVIYTSQALRNKAFGSGLEFAWSSVGTGDYAVRESISRIKTFKNFKEQHVLRPPLSSAEGMFGGHCLGVKGPDSVVFFDWDEGLMIRKIDVVPNNVFWNETGELVLLACDEVYYVLRYDAATVQAAIAQGQVDSEEGIASAFDLVHEMHGTVKMGQWVGDCFIYTNEKQRLVYFVGGEVMTLSHLDRPMQLLGYLPKEDRVFLMDQSKSIVSYRVLQSYLQYQTAVVRKDFNAANALLPSIPKSEYTMVARFLESQGFKEEALQVSQDEDHRFDLACELGKLDMAKDLLLCMPEEDRDTLDAQSKWKRVGDLALAKGDLTLFAESAHRAADLPGLLLLYSSTGDFEGMEKLAETAEAAGKINVAFISSLLTGKLEKCASLLIASGRLPEAAFFARTYLPSAVGDIVAQWRAQLKSCTGSVQVSEKLAEAIADPVANPELFPDIDVALKVEEAWKSRVGNRIPASSWAKAQDDLNLDLISMFKNMGLRANGELSPTAPPPVSPSQPQGVDDDDMQEDTDDYVSLDNDGAPAGKISDDKSNKAAAEASRVAEEKAAREAAEAESRRVAGEKAAREAAEARRLAEEKAARQAAAAAEARRVAEENAAKEAAEAKEKAAKEAAEAEARRLAEEKAAREAAEAKEKAAREAAEAEARRVAEEKAAREAAEAKEKAAREAAEAEARRVAEESSAREAAERAEAAKAKVEQEARARAEAAKAKAIAAAQARAEAARKAAEDAARANAEAKAKAEAEAAAAGGGDDGGDVDLGDDFGEDW